MALVFLRLAVCRGSQGCLEGQILLSGLYLRTFEKGSPQLVAHAKFNLTRARHFGASLPLTKRGDTVFS